MNKDHLTEIPSLTDNDFIRCTKCGSESRNVDDLQHLEGCPVKE